MPRATKIMLALAAVAAAGAIGVGIYLYLLPVSDNNKEGPGKPALKRYPNTPHKVEDWQRHPETEALAVVLDQKAEYVQRVKAIEKLDNGLRDKLVLDIIKEVQDPAVHSTIRNDLLSKLESQERPVGTLGPLLIKMYEDPAQDFTWHNYCLQHLVPVWKLEPDHRQQIVDALFGVMEKESGEGKDQATMSETAMLALSKIGHDDPEVAARISKQAAAQLAQRDKDPERAVTAMHLAAGAGDKSVLPEARKIAVDQNALARLRMSAMATLGTLGEKEDVALLTKLASGPEGRIKTAAELNLKTLRGRLGE